MLAIQRQLTQTWRRVRITCLDLIHLAVAFTSAFLAGAINSVAGGGTLVSFPALIWLGLNSVTANATSTVAIWPGTIGSMWGYRRELREAESRFRILIVPSLLGGITGALLLRWTKPAFFDELVPFLILFATMLFVIQGPIQRLLKTGDAESHKSTKWMVGALLFQLAVGIYGGYFGAGIGILTLALLQLLGIDSIHKMNALKTLLTAGINAVTMLIFITSGKVVWSVAAAMIPGSICGGYCGAKLALRVPPQSVRAFVIAVACATTLYFFVCGV